MLPFRRRRAADWRAFFYLLSILLILVPAGSLFSKTQKPKAPKQKKHAAASPTGSGSPGEVSLTNIPLPIGHEAKGLVLPDFSPEGKLVGKFEAGKARRTDVDHIRFEDLKITTFTPENKVDLEVQMPTSMFDLKTKILSSQERSTIKRADFNVVGDSVQFDTTLRTGKMIGNVKMVINSQSQLIEKPNEPKSGEPSPVEQKPNG